MTPRISVVVPAYNRAHLIGETLEAILGQALPPAEVIVVDDGSTDATPDVLARYAGPVRTLRIPNSGELVARNTGLRAAQGDLVAFCDSDDLWRADHLASMARLWARWPETRAAYANFRIVRDGAWSERDKFADAPAGFWDGLDRDEGGIGLFRTEIVARLIRFMPFFPSAMVARADVLRAAGGWDEAVNRWMSMDLATTLRIGAQPPVGVVLTPTVGIRKHAHNFSADMQAMNLGDAAILDHVLRMQGFAAPHAEAIRASIRRRRLAALELAFGRRDFEAVERIHALLDGRDLPGRIRVKLAVARLPEPHRGRVAGLLLRAGSLKARLAPRAPTLR